MKTEYEVRVLDVQSVFENIYKIDIGKMKELRFGEKLNEKYKLN